MRDRPKSPPHFRRKNKSLMNVRFPFAVPIATLPYSESVVVVLVPIASLSAIVVVEPIMIMVIAVVIAVISLVMMIAVVMILGVSERYS